MAPPSAAPSHATAPVFVLSAERTGSTLLRYLLDTHPDLHCPDELNLGQACAAVASAIEGAWGREGERDEEGVRQLSAETIAETRAFVEGFMASATTARGKRIWCEKSPTNLGELALLEQVFPQARYLCLYRHCLDFAKSALAACRFSFWPGLAPYVHRSPQNLIEAMALAWVEKTRTELGFERAHSDRCLRIRYEALASDPQGVLSELSGFLGLEFGSDLPERAFTAPHPHRVGHGDESARFATQVYTSRLGLGNELPWRERLSAETMEVVNGLLDELGYPHLDPARERYEVGVEVAEQQRTYPQGTVRRFFEEQLPALLAAQGGAPPGVSSSFQFQITGEDAGQWVLDLAGPSAPRVCRDGEAQVSIQVASGVFLDLVNGVLSAPSALREGKLKIEGIQDASEMMQLVQLLSAASGVDATAGRNPPAGPAEA